ncbi:MAG: class I SAM-dependent methyltransferase [Burkholderiaceae bacterium]|nr:MAG: class I SAM-dependent methyltransferase [Burkholderiaceae bacterium]
MSLPEKCPLCQVGREQQTVVTPHVYGGAGKGHSFFHCLGCDVRYMYPGLTSAEEARFYAAEFEGFMAGRAGAGGGWQKVEDHIQANEPTRLRRMKYLAPYLGHSSNLLEVGCSSGFMLAPLIEAGHKCVGVEPSGVFSEHLKSRGLPICQSMDQLSSLPLSADFDLIMHFFVLEHIAQPQAFLEAQLALLKPGGKIIFEIPNAADPLYSVYDIPAFERFYWSVAHPWYFSEASLQYLLQQIGRPFQILRDQRYDLSNHMIWARDGRPGGMGRFTEALGSELEDDYKQALIRIGKCDTLIGIISNE